MSNGNVLARNFSRLEICLEAATRTLENMNIQLQRGQQYDSQAQRGGQGQGGTQNQQAQQNQTAATPPISSSSSVWDKFEKGDKIGEFETSP